MDYLTPEELKKHSELKREYNKLVSELQENQAALTQIKNQIRGKPLSAKQYKACCDGQQKRIQRIGWLTTQMRLIKDQLGELTTTETIRRNEFRNTNDVAMDNEEVSIAPEKQESKDLALIMEISTIRDEYRRFSADPTRVSSMRRNAAEFANRLDAIVSRYQ